MGSNWWFNFKDNKMGFGCAPCREVGRIVDSAWTFANSSYNFNYLSISLTVQLMEIIAIAGSW